MEDCFLVVDKTGVVGSAMYIFLSESKSKRSLVVVISPICGTLGSCGGVRCSDADRIGVTFGDGGSLRRSFVVGEESRGFRGVLGACFLK